jgi:SAM-dependent methyltransferase
MSDRSFCAAMRPARHFDALAENYDRREELRGDPLEPWLRRVLPAVAGSAVDLGCGAGRHATVIAEHYEHVLAVDLSKKVIDLARRRRPRANIEYRRADLLDVNGQFDLVFSSSALHDLPDLDCALAHIRSLVAPQGRAIIADVVAPLSPVPSWFFRAGALIHLPIDLMRRRKDAFALYRLDADPAWIAHLASDRYLSRSGFEHRYSAHFPGATFHRARHLHVCCWAHADGPRRRVYRETTIARDSDQSLVLTGN